eukprot:4330826-Prymnesium_polylepis.1
MLIADAALHQYRAARVMGGRCATTGARAGGRVCESRVLEGRRREAGAARRSPHRVGTKELCVCVVTRRTGGVPDMRAFSSRTLLALKLRKFI